MLFEARHVWVIDDALVALCESYLEFVVPEVSICFPISYSMLTVFISDSYQSGTVTSSNSFSKLLDGFENVSGGFAPISIHGPVFLCLLLYDGPPGIVTLWTR